MAVFGDASWTIAGERSPAGIGQIRYADQYKGATAGEQITSAMNDCPSQGCVILATGYTSPQSIAKTINLPADKTVYLYLAPVIWKCNAYPCFNIRSASGVHILGGFGDDAVGKSVSQYGSGTILRSIGSLTGTSDLIDVTGGANVEIGNMVLDFDQTGTASGRYGIDINGTLRSHLHDISTYNAGVDCYRWETSNNSPTYDSRLENVDCHAAGSEGFMLISNPGTGHDGTDLARWHCIQCRYFGYAIGDTTDRFGSYGFHLQITNANGGRAILGDVYCDDCVVSGFYNAIGSAGVYLDQIAGTNSYPMYNIWYSGGIEGGAFADKNAGLAVKVSAAAGAVIGLHFFYGAAGLTSFPFDQINNSNASGYFDQYQASSGLGKTSITVDSITSGGTAFLSLPSSPVGTMIYCSDCKNVQDDGAIAGAKCKAGGHGTIARRDNSAAPRWDCN